MKTFVVLGSSQILTRKWCLGEMVIARLEKVDTVLLTFPGFELPDEQFMKLYHKLVPDIGDFASYGFGIAEVQETLKWLSSVKQIPVSRDFDEGSLKLGASARDKALQKYRGYRRIIPKWVHEHLGGTVGGTLERWCWVRGIFNPRLKTLGSHSCVISGQGKSRMFG